MHWNEDNRIPKHWDTDKSDIPVFTTNETKNLKTILLNVHSFLVDILIFWICICK